MPRSRSEVSPATVAFSSSRFPKIKIPFSLLSLKCSNPAARRRGGVAARRPREFSSLIKNSPTTPVYRNLFCDILITRLYIILASRWDSRVYAASTTRGQKSAPVFRTSRGQGGGREVSSGLAGSEPVTIEGEDRNIRSLPVESRRDSSHRLSRQAPSIFFADFAQPTVP